jgi:RNA-binding protein
MHDPSLTSKQRAHLRALAHGLKPVLQVGNDGIGDAFLHSLEEAFHTRELLKVRVLGSAPENARTAADMIMARLPEVTTVMTIGRTVALYRPFPENPEIALPR